MRGIRGVLVRLRLEFGGNRGTLPALGTEIEICLSWLETSVLTTTLWPVAQGVCQGPDQGLLDHLFSFQGLDHCCRKGEHPIL